MKYTELNWGVTVNPTMDDLSAFHDYADSTLKPTTFQMIYNLFKSFLDLIYPTGDGWLTSGETWTYASATTFTVWGDVTSKYQRGDRIKLTQSSTVKYFNVLKVAYATGTTTITISGGTDYTLANSAITLNYYSKAVSPQGWPDWFNFVPTWGGFSVAPVLSFAKFRIQGNTCFINISCSGNGTSNANTCTVSVNDGIQCVGQAWGNWGYPVDNSASFGAVYCYILNASSTINLAKAMDNPSTWTASGGKRAEASISFQWTL
jgi:hypothetical protein